MTTIPLSKLMAEGRPATHPVASRKSTFTSFANFREDVARAASKFEKRNRALLICRDSYNFAVGFYGLLHADAQIVLPPNRQPGTLQNLQQEYDLLVDDDAVEESSDKKAKLRPLNPTRPYLSFFTSGSTGTPKMVSKSLGMLEGEIEILNGLWNKDADQNPVFATVSHQHIYGLTFKLLWPLMAGRPFVSETHSSWDDLLSALTPGATIISSPAHLGRLDGIAPLSSQQKPKQIFSAGAALPHAASEQTRKVLGCSPTEIFGSTETGAFATRTQKNENEPWQLLPGISMRCDDDKRLSLHSPFIGSDWITTQDLAEPLPDGFRYIGRADRIAKIEGKRVSLIEIERALERLPHVKSVAVVVLDDNPNQLAAAVVPTEEGFESLKKIGNFRFGRLLRDNLMPEHEAAGIPRLWRFIEELPSRGLGKHRDADIRALFGRRQ